MAVSQLGYIGLGVRDVAGWSAFARDVLGMEVAGQADDGSTYLRMDELHHRVILHEDDRDDLAYVGWQTRNREEFAATLASLEAAGVSIAPSTEEERSLRRVRDLVRFEASGVAMELFYGPTVLFEKPFQPGARISGFRTGDMGMGHIAFAGDDPQELARILIEGLGFSVGDSFAGFECLLRCNRRENTVFIPAARYEGEKRLNHFMLELNSIDDVGSGLDRCEEHGIEVTSQLGRHTNDLSISFYLRTPAGFRIEYGWDSKTVDDTAEWPVREYERSSVWGHRRTAAR